MISSLHHVSFTVSDMERSLTFYRDILGLKVLWDSKQEGVRFKGSAAEKITGCSGAEMHIVFLAAGDNRIELIEYTPEGKPLVDHRACDIGSAHVCFKTQNIQELYERLIVNRVRVHCPPQILGRARVFYFRDPDGIILEAAQGELPA